MSDDKFIQEAQALESALGLRKGFLESLYLEDDWSFVIKIHALVEAAVAHALTDHIGRPELSGIFSRLPLSDKQVGKIAFAKELRTLHKPVRRFVASLSELRNQLAHDITYVDFSFDQYIGGLTDREVDELAKTLTVWATGDELEISGENINRAVYFREKPKFVIWSSTVALFAIIYQNKLAKNIIDAIRIRYVKAGIAALRAEDE